MKITENDSRPCIISLVSRVFSDLLGLTEKITCELISIHVLGLVSV